MLPGLSPVLTAEDAASVATAVHVIATERAALAHLENLYQTHAPAQSSFARAVAQIADSIENGGKLVVCGVGKSGKIARKIEATMNSLGLFCAFLHPTEALHGDLGLIRAIDTLLLVSFSGRTPELMQLLPHIPPTVGLIALTSHIDRAACPLLAAWQTEQGILLPAPLHEDEEASFGVSAPTSSTTAALCLGDALAIAAARRVHARCGRAPREVFRDNHPGGAIGADYATLASAASTPNSMSASVSTTSFASLSSLSISSLSTMSSLPSVSTAFMASTSSNSTNTNSRREAGLRPGEPAGLTAAKPSESGLHSDASGAGPGAVPAFAALS